MESMLYVTTILAHYCRKMNFIPNSNNVQISYEIHKCLIKLMDENDKKIVYFSFCRRSAFLSPSLQPFFGILCIIAAMTLSEHFVTLINLY